MIVDVVVAFFIAAARAAAEWKSNHPRHPAVSVAVMRIRARRAQETLRSLGLWPMPRASWELVPEEQLN